MVCLTRPDVTGTLLNGTGEWKHAAPQADQAYLQTPPLRLFSDPQSSGNN